MVTYQISAMSAILEARLGENFIGPKNQEQVYIELVFAADHDAVIVDDVGCPDARERAGGNTARALCPARARRDNDVGPARLVSSMSIVGIYCTYAVEFDMLNVQSTVIFLQKNCVSTMFD